MENRFKARLHSQADLLQLNKKLPVLIQISPQNLEGSKNLLKTKLASMQQLHKDPSKNFEKTGINSPKAI